MQAPTDAPPRYRLLPAEKSLMGDVLAERAREHDSQPYAFGYRASLLLALANIIEHADSVSPLLMTAGMSEQLTEAVTLASCRTPEQLRAWLTARRLGGTPLAHAVRDLEWREGAAVARRMLLELMLIVRAVTAGD